MAVYRATVDLTFPVGNGGGTNTFALRTSALGDTLSIIALMGYVEDFYDAISEWFPSNWVASWDGTVQELGSPTPAYSDPVTGWSVTGDAPSSSFLPTAAMVCVNWRTSVATRSGRGRTFLGPLSTSSAESNGTPAAAFMTDVRAAAAALVTASQSMAGDGAIAVWSEKDSVARDIVSSSVTDQYAVLRSRRG